MKKVIVTLICITGLIFLGAAVFLIRLDIPAETVDMRYAGPESAFVEIKNGARVHVRDQGKKGADVLVLVHGSSASLHTWEPWVAILQECIKMWGICPWKKSRSDPQSILQNLS